MTHPDTAPTFGTYPCCGETDEAPGNPWHYLDCPHADPDLVAHAVDQLADDPDNLDELAAAGHLEETP